METHKERKGPLAGIKVIDLTHAVAGPSCSLLLADMGADVIKVEAPSGDHFRPVLDGCFFFNFNRNKRGICLNLKEKEGKEILFKLLHKADVFLENFVPGTMDRLGLGYDTVNKLNPGIIYCSISGYGQSGPYRDRPAYDPILQAMSGMMDATGVPDRPPVRILPAMIDYGGGMNAAFAIAVSIIEKQKTGQGNRIDVALLDVAITPMGVYMANYKRTGEIPQRLGSGHPGWVPYENFETDDGLVLLAVNTDQMWKRFCQVLGLDELGKDSRYFTLEGRRKHRAELVAAVSRLLKPYKTEDLVSKLLAADVPCGPVQTVADVLKDPHVLQRQLLEEIDIPQKGKYVTTKTPIRISGQFPPTWSNPPLLGEHTTEVLKELGYNDEEIRVLIQKGIALQYKL